MTDSRRSSNKIIYTWLVYSQFEHFLFGKHHVKIYTRERERKREREMSRLIISQPFWALFIWETSGKDRYRRREKERERVRENEWERDCKIEI